MNIPMKFLVIIILIAVSPLFGVIGAEIVGYHEPLDVAVDTASQISGVEVKEVSYWSGILPDYTVPGVNNVTGYIVSGFIGVLILLVPFILRRKM